MNDHAPIPTGIEGVRIRGDGCTAEAGWFGPDDRPRFGWLYRPDTPAPNSVGVVIVPPFGFEAVCAHRSIRHLAAAAAAAGFLALRFDLDGTGDSAGDDTDPGRIAAWQASVLDACDLVRGAGAEHLVLIGVRLGATLASLAAASRDDIVAFIAINGVVRGRDFLREARALQAAMGLRMPSEPLPDDGSQEVNGFVIAAETRAQLGDIDLNQCNAPPAPRALLIERNDMPERRRWPERLRALGVEVEIHPLPGLAEMLDVPHLASVPPMLLDACITYVQKITTSLGRATTSPRSAGFLRPDARIPTGSTVIVEQAVLIDDGMFGILTHPDSTTPCPGIVLFNAGAVKHTGPNRMYVTWARQWATTGYCVLRADISGIGDSTTRVDAEENQVYGEHGIADASCIATWFRQYGATRIVACGNCSGAYHALRAAINGDMIDAIMLINPLAMQYIGTISNIATEQYTDSYYNNQIKGGRGLHKLFSGTISLRKLARVAGWYASTYGNMFARNLLRKARWTPRNDLGTDLQALADRSVKIHFVFSADDHSRALLAVQAGSTVKRLIRQGHIHVQVIDGPDHTFTQCWAQAQLHDALLTILAQQDK